MSESDVIALMESTLTLKEWDENCDKVKAACGGYPEFWFTAINMSGLMARVLRRCKAAEAKAAS